MANKKHLRNLISPNHRVKITKISRNLGRSSLRILRKWNSVCFNSKTLIIFRLKRIIKISSFCTTLMIRFPEISMQTSIKSYQSLQKTISNQSSLLAYLTSKSEALRIKKGLSDSLQWFSSKKVDKLLNMKELTPLKISVSGL